MTREAGERAAANSGRGLERALELAIEGLENEAGFDLEGLLSKHAEHAAAVRERITKLQRAGMLRRAAPDAAAVELLDERLLPARKIAGRYRALREIGRGGMGRVLLAHDERLARDVAIKLAHKSGDDAARARLEREARLLAQLEHPGIVAVYDGGTTDDGRAFCAMRVVGGRTLHEVIAAGDPPAELGLARKVQIAIAVCDAVGFAHSRGIVHRDLKPANVMLGGSGEVQVVDWGLAKRIGAPDPDAPSERESFASFTTGAYETVDGYAFGTPSYCAPEQARGEIAQIDERSDVFGLGAILHHLLAGRPPYYGADRAEVLERARAGRFNDPDLTHATPRVPAELVAVCRKACATNKPERYASPRELADDLRAFLETRTVRAYRTGAWAETMKWLARNRAVAASLVVAVLAMAAGTIASGVYAGRAQAEAEYSGAIFESVVTIFDGAQALEKPAKDVTVLELLDVTQDKYRESAPRQPRVAAAMFYALARANAAFGRMKEVEPLARLSVDAFRASDHPRDEVRLAASLLLLSRAQSGLGNYEAAARSTEDARTQGAGAWRPVDELHALSESAFVAMQRGELDRAAATLEAGTSLFEIVREQDAAVASYFLNTRAMVRGRRGEVELAIADCMLVLVLAEKNGAPPDTLAVLMNNLSAQYFALRRYAEARAWNERALTTLEDQLAPTHDAVLAARSTAAEIARVEQRLEFAEETADEVLTARLEVNGSNARETLRAQRALAAIRLELGKLDEVEEPLLDALRRQTVQFGPDDRETLASSFTLAELRSRQGRDDEARELCAQVLAGYARTKAPPLQRIGALALSLDLQRKLPDAKAAEATARELLSVAPADSPEAELARAYIAELNGAGR